MLHSINKSTIDPITTTRSILLLKINLKLFNWLKKKPITITHKQKKNNSKIFLWKHLKFCFSTWIIFGVSIELQAFFIYLYLYFYNFHAKIINLYSAYYWKFSLLQHFIHSFYIFLNTFFLLFNSILFWLHSLLFLL